VAEANAIAARGQSDRRTPAANRGTAELIVVDDGAEALRVGEVCVRARIGEVHEERLVPLTRPVADDLNGTVIVLTFTPTGKLSVPLAAWKSPAAAVPAADA
jgi:hypothetical protein